MPESKSEIILYALHATLFDLKSLDMRVIEDMEALAGKREPEAKE